MADVVWSDDALADLDSIVDYVELHDPGAAKRVRAELIDCGQSLAVFPRHGRPADGGLREMVSVPPYVLTYSVEDDSVHIVELRHGRQLPRNRR